MVASLPENINLYKGFFESGIFALLNSAFVAILNGHRTGKTAEEFFISLEMHQQCLLAFHRSL